MIQKDQEMKKTASVLDRKVKIMKMKETTSVEREQEQKRQYESVIQALRKEKEAQLNKSSSDLAESSFSRSQEKKLANLKKKIRLRDLSIEKLQKANNMKQQMIEDASWKLQLEEKVK